MSKKLRQKLNAYVAVYGTLDPRTLEVSSEVDKLICNEMKKIQARKRTLGKGFN